MAEARLSSTRSALRNRSANAARALINNYRHPKWDKELPPQHRRDFLSGVVPNRGSHIPLFWQRDFGGTNFGDELSWMIISELTGLRPIWTSPRRTCLVSTGSLLEKLITQVPRHESVQRLVWGSGFMSEPEDPLKIPRAQIIAVRGEWSLTGLTQVDSRAVSALGDPALLVSSLSLVPDRDGRPDGLRGPLLIPHFVDAKSPQVAALRRTVDGLDILDVRDNPLSIVSAIAQSSLVISSGLHPLIVADAFEIPSVWLRLSDRVKGNDFKFRDHDSTLGIRSEPVDFHTVLSAGNAIMDLARPSPPTGRIRQIQTNLLTAFARMQKGGDVEFPPLT